MIEYSLFFIQFAFLTALLFLFRHLQQRLAEAESAQPALADLEMGLSALVVEVKLVSDRIDADLAARAANLEALIQLADARLKPSPDPADGTVPGPRPAGYPHPGWLSEIEGAVGTRMPAGDGEESAGALPIPVEPAPSEARPPHRHLRLLPGR